MTTDNKKEHVGDSDMTVLQPIGATDLCVPDMLRLFFRVPGSEMTACLPGG